MLGSTVVLVLALAGVAAATMSGGGTTRPKTVAVAASSPAPPSPPSAGHLIPLASGKPTVKTTKASPRRASPSTAKTQHRSTAPATPVSYAPPAAPAQTTVSTPEHKALTVPEPLGYWYLNDDDPAQTAADVMGSTTLTGSNVSWCTAGNGNCAVFNGASSAFTSSGPVLDTAPGSSFTVAAWVDMKAIAANNGFETIVSQDSVYDSGFYLQYSGSDMRWAFSRVTGDTDNNPAGIRALSKSAPALNTWTHLVGVYDAADSQLRLYVNGVLQDTKTDTSPFAASGDLAIGRAQFDGKETDWFDGSANRIKVWDTALTTAQIAKI